MLSDRIYCFLGLALPKLARLGLLNCTWDSKTNLFALVQNKRKYIQFPLFNLILLASWILFHIVQIFRFYAKKDINSFILVSAGLMVLTIIAICCAICNIWANELFPLMNTFLVFFRHINGK